MGCNCTIYTSATLVGNGDSGVLSLATIINDTRLAPLLNPNALVIKSAWVRMVPENLATDETLALDLNVSWDAAGAGDVKVHDFTGVTSSNVAETVILPGEESEANLQFETGTAAGVLAAPIPPFWKFIWTLGGTTKSMNFTVYAALIF